MRRIKEVLRLHASSETFSQIYTISFNTRIVSAAYGRMYQHDQQTGLVAQPGKLTERLLLCKKIVIQVDTGSARSQQVPVQIYQHY